MDFFCSNCNGFEWLLNDRCNGLQCCWYCKLVKIQGQSFPMHYYMPVLFIVLLLLSDSAVLEKSSQPSLGGACSRKDFCGKISYNVLHTMDLFAHP